MNRRALLVVGAWVAILGTPALAQIHAIGVRRLLPTFSDAEAKSTGPGHPWFNGPYLPALHPGPGFINSFVPALQVEAPLIVLHTPGGVAFPVALHHSSMAAYSNPVLGLKWNHSLWVFMLPYVEQDGVQRMGIYWGEHREQRFKLQGGQWAPIDGYRDTLQTTPTTATLTLHDRTRLEFFAGPIAGKPAYKLDRIIDTSGNTIEINHDSLGRVASATDPFGRTVTLTYNANNGRLGEVTFAYQTFSRTWDIGYNPMNLPAQIVYPQVTTDLGPQTYSTSFQYDLRSNITHVTDREGHTWLYGYDIAPAPDRLRWAQPPGNTPAERFEYKWIDPLTREFVDPVGNTTLVGYDKADRVVKWIVGEQLPGGLWVTTVHYLDPDFSWSPSIVTAPSGTTWKFDWDAAGNMVGYTDPAGHRWDYAFDQFNNLTQILQPLVTDAWGITEPARRQTIFEYDPNHRLILLRRLAAFSSPLSVYHEWFFVYSLLGQLTQVTNPLGPGHTWTCAYDPGHGNLVKITSPETRTFEWLYTEPEGTYGFTVPDAVRNGLMQTTNLVRDEWGRLRVKDYPFSPDEKFSWDGLSRLTRTEGGPFAIPTFYTYHDFGGLFTQQRGPQFIQIDRLPNGLRSAVTESGVPMPRNLQYQYGPRNELVTLIDSGAAINFAYDLDLRLISRSLPNGATASFFYLDGLLKSIVHKDAGLLPFATFSYTYQTNGQRMQVTELDGSVVRYGYDLLNRLEREERTGIVPYDFEWTYDGAGNRLTQALNGLVENDYTYDHDNLLQSMTLPPSLSRQYTWDGAARLTQRATSGPATSSTETFFSDDAGRLIHAETVIKGGVSTILGPDSFYNALGQRVMRRTFTLLGRPESQTGFFDLALSPFREEKVSFQGGQTSFRPTFAGGLVRWLDANTGQCMYPATDADGSVRAWTDNSGAVGPYTAVSNAFGQHMLDQGPRPPYAFAADSAVRNDGDLGWLALPGGAFYSPLEQIIVGAGDDLATPAFEFAPSLGGYPYPHIILPIEDEFSIAGRGANIDVFSIAGRGAMAAPAFQQIAPTSNVIILCQLPTDCYQGGAEPATPPAWTTAPLPYPSPAARRCIWCHCPEWQEGVRTGNWSDWRRRNEGYLQLQPKLEHYDWRLFD